MKIQFWTIYLFLKVLSNDYWCSMRVWDSVWRRLDEFISLLCSIIFACDIRLDVNALRKHKKYAMFVESLQPFLLLIFDKNLS